MHNKYLLGLLCFILMNGNIQLEREFKGDIKSKEGNKIIGG